MRKILFGLAVMLALVMPAYADTVTAKIGVACEKNSPEGPFEFNIEKVDNAPTPDMSELWLKRGQKRDFTIQVREPGTYLYTIYQTKGTDTRINYDDTVYKAYVFVESDDEGFLSVPAVVISREDNQIKEDFCSFKNKWIEITDEDRDAANLVADMIDALPDPKDATAADKNQVDLCKEAYDNLTDLQKSLIPEAKKKLDAVEAAVVADMIYSLPYPVVTPEEMSDVETVKDLYDQLSDEQKEMIKDAKERLDLVEAAVVAAMINQLPYPATADDLEDIYNVKEYYNRLSDDQKAMIPESKVRLDNCETSAVADMIDRLPTPEDVTFDDREAVLRAKEAFDKLSPEQQATIPESKQKLDELLEALDRKDREVANTVAEMIKNLPDPDKATGDDLDLVNIVKDTYDDLTDYQKSLIQDEKQRLDDVEVAVVRDLINRLPNPEDAKSTDRPAVNVAKDAYNALSDDQKSKLTQEKEKLDAVDAAVAEAERRDREAAQRVADLINALPDPNDATAADRPAVDEAKEVYENLTDEQKALIPDEKARLDAIDTVVSIDEKDGDEAARAVEALINALPNPEDATSKDRMAVDTAKAAYNKLSDLAKALITEAKARLDAIDAAVAECERIDSAAANAVAEMIRNLPDPNHAIAADRSAVEAAKEAYNQLTDYQKSLIPEEKAKLDDVDLAVVEDMIYNLPDPKDAGKDDKPAVDAARKAFDGLTEEQQNSIPEMKKKLEDVEVAVVQDMIDRIPVPSTADDYDDIFAAREAYEKLNEEQKKKIKNLDKLYDQELAAVKDMIQKLPDPKDVTLSDKPAVERARTAFNHLSDTQKAKIPNEKAKLEALEAMIRAFEEDENAEGDRVKALIDALPDPEIIRVSDKDAVYEAKDAYKALSDSQKDRIKESKEKLDACEAALVKALIDALPDPITAADKDQVQEARDAFDELTQRQKDMIPGAEDKLKQAEVDLLKEIINALPNPEDATSSDRAAVDEAKELFNKLSDDQKEQLKAEKERLDAIDRAVTEAERRDREAAQRVADMIDALPDPRDAKASDRSAVDEAKEAYDQLTDYQKSLIEDKKAKLDAVDAMVKIAEQLNEDIVAELISNLPNPEDATINDRPAVDAAKEAYNRLTDDQKERIVDSKKRLDEIDNAVKALEDEAMKHANEVRELIESLPDPAKIKDYDDVKNALEEYKALTDYEKSLIPEAKEKLDKAVMDIFRDAIADILNDGKITKDDWDLIQWLKDMYDGLTDDQKKILEDEKKQLDEMERECIMDIVNSLPDNPTEADWDAYNKTREAFDRLSDDQKEKLRNLKDKLDAMGVAIIRDMINHLPDPEDATSLDRDAVEKAKAAYRTLSDDQKQKLVYEKARLDEIDVAVTLAEETDRRAAEAVAAMINALPNPEDATSADRADVDAAKAAYNALTQTQKNLIVKEKARLDAIDEAVDKAEKLDWKAVKEVIAMINQLPEPEDATANDRNQVNDCYEAYNQLTKEQKALIQEYKKKLDEVDAMVMLAEQSGDAKTVADMINALPNPENATSEDRAQVDAAKRAYDALSDKMKETIQKEKIRLDAIDAAVAEAERIDSEAASAVEAMINVLPEPEDVKSTDRPAVDAAKLAYNSLTSYQKSLIAKAKRRLDTIDLALSAVENADLQAANAVAALIERLPEPEDATANDRSAVNIARAAYEKLTDAQKALIPEYKKKLDAVDAAVRAAENKKSNSIDSGSDSNGSSSGNNSGSGSGSGFGSGSGSNSGSGSGTNSGTNNGNSQSNSSRNLNNVKTGDMNPIEIFVIVMIAAMAVVFVSGRRRKIEE